MCKSIVYYILQGRKLEGSTDRLNPPKNYQEPWLFVRLISTQLLAGKKGRSKGNSRRSTRDSQWCLAVTRPQGWLMIWSNYDVKTIHTSVISAAVHCECQFSERSLGILNHLMLCCKANHLTRWDELFHLNGFHYHHYFPKTEGNFSSEQTTEAAGEKWRAGRWFKDFKGSQLVLFNCWLEPHKWVSDKIRYDQSTIERVLGLPSLR